MHSINATSREICLSGYLIFHATYKVLSVFHKSDPYN